MIYPHFFDEVDREWMASIVPSSAAMVEGYIAVAIWVDAKTGQRQWRTLIRSESSTDSVIGIMNLATLQQSLLSMRLISEPDEDEDE